MLLLLNRLLFLFLAGTVIGLWLVSFQGLAQDDDSDEYSAVLPVIPNNGDKPKPSSGSFDLVIPDSNKSKQAKPIVPATDLTPAYQTLDSMAADAVTAANQLNALPTAIPQIPVAGQQAQSAVVPVVVVPVPKTTPEPVLPIVPTVPSISVLGGGNQPGTPPRQLFPDAADSVPPKIDAAPTLGLPQVSKTPAFLPTPTNTFPVTPDAQSETPTTVVDSAPELPLQETIQGIPSGTSALITPFKGLSISETEAVTLSEGWKERYSPATLGRNGEVVYHFGESMAAVITAPGNVTDIKLELGEAIVPSGILIGDTINWAITPVLQTLRNNQFVSHLIIKPFYSDLSTTMTVVTNKRTYYFYLRSTKERFMSSVGFSYRTDRAASYSDYHHAVSLAQQVSPAGVATPVSFEVPASGGTGTAPVPSDVIDFKFEIFGDSAQWTPVRVYSYINKTYIQMPRRMRHGESPVFLAIDSNGDRRLVNYRVQGDSFVIDALVNEGVLLTGVGRNQTEVRFRYIGDTFDKYQIAPKVENLDQ